MKSHTVLLDLFPNKVWHLNEMGDHLKRAFIEHPVVDVDYVGVDYVGVCLNTWLTNYYTCSYIQLAALCNVLNTILLQRSHRLHIL